MWLLGLALFILLPIIYIEALVLLFFKFLEQVTDGRFKFFDRRLNEPIYQKRPRPVSFF